MLFSFYIEFLLQYSEKVFLFDKKRSSSKENVKCEEGYVSVASLQKNYLIEIQEVISHRLNQLRKTSK